MDKLPPLNALRAFEASGHYLNFRLAADALGVTQGAVAQQVRLLEAHLGTKLFERLPKGLAFTNAGQGYHGAVVAVFSDLRRATDILRPEPGKIVISATPTFAAKWLIPHMPEFADTHPDIDLRILATEKVSSFHSDGIDLAVRQGMPPFGASIDATLLYRQELIAVAAPRLLAQEGMTAGEHALELLPKLHDGHDLWPQFLHSLDLEEKEARGLRLSQTSLAIDAAIQGQGLALVSRFLVARDIAEGRLVQITSHSLQADKDFYLLSQLKSKRSDATEIVRSWLLFMAGTEDGNI